MQNNENFEIAAKLANNTKTYSRIIGNQTVGAVTIGEDTITEEDSAADQVSSLDQS